MQVKIREQEKNRLVLEFDERDHGILNLIKKTIWEVGGEHIEFAGYQIAHPEVSNPIFILKTKGKDAKAIWNAAISSAMKSADQLAKILKKLK